MRKITEEMGVHKEWYNEARNMTPENLNEFINRLMNEYEHDYGTIVHAIAAGAIATCWAMNKYPQGGITGFQAGCLMWSFIRHWNHSDNKSGLKLVDYDNMLYPQYEERFDKTISSETWEKLQEMAKERLNENNTNVHPEVVFHWKSIASGVIPFGYKIKDDD